MELKYVMFEYMNNETPVVFPRWVNHNEVRIQGRKPISAGFVFIENGVCMTYGKSTSLKISSKEEDGVFIEKMLFGNK